MDIEHTTHHHIAPRSVSRRVVPEDRTPTEVSPEEVLAMLAAAGVDATVLYEGPALGCLHHRLELPQAA